MDFIVDNQALIRACINGTTAVLCFYLSFVIAVFLIVSWLELAPPRTIAAWRRVGGTPTACALFWLFLFAGYSTANVWQGYLGSVVAQPFMPAADPKQTISFFLSGIGFDAALLRLTFLFSPPKLQSKLWLISVAMALIVVIITVAN